MRKSIATLLLLAFSLTGSKASELVDVKTVNGVQYTVYDTGAYVSRLEDYKQSSVVIEDSIAIDGVKYPVVRIDMQAFYNSSLESVKIPNTVQTIDVEAFAYCNRLKEVTLPDSLKSLLRGAFSYCGSLESLVIPEKVAFIGSNLVNECYSLKRIDIQSTVEVTIYQSSFRISSSYSETVKPKLEAINVTPENPTLCSVDGVLYSKNMKTLIQCPETKEGRFVVPDGVERLAPKAFQNCASLTAIDLPGSLRELGDRPAIPSYTTGDINGVMRNCRSLTEITIPDGVTWIGASDFSNCVNLRKVVLPQTLTVIGRNAFINDSLLVDMILPESLDSLEEAFDYCYKYKPALPQNLRYIGNAAFVNCTAPDSLVIGERLLFIGYLAFAFPEASRQNLKKIYVCQAEPLEQGANYLEYRLFGYETVKVGRMIEEVPPTTWSDGCTLYVPTGSKEKYQASEWWGFFKQIEEFDYSGSWEPEKPDDPTVQPDSIFRAKTEEGIELGYTIISEEEKTCKVNRYLGIPNGENTQITIPREVNGYTVMRIGQSAFSGTSGITSITIPESVTAIEATAFSMSQNLTRLTIPNSVKEIGGYLFHNCPSLTEVSLPEGLEAIPDGMFNDCRNLATVNMPTGVKKIGENAFFYCRSLEAIELPEGLAEIGDRAFYNCAALTDIRIPKTVSSIGKEAFIYVSPNIISVAEGNTVYDSRGACNALIETATNTLLQGSNQTVIPQDVESIGSAAFYGCKDIVSVDIPESVASIGASAFAECTGLEHVNLPTGIKSIKSMTFSGCNTLKSVVIPAQVASIGDDAFFGCSALESVTTLIKEPFPISDNVFQLYDESWNLLPSKAILYVPAGTKDVYAVLSGWSSFADIREMEDTAIDPLRPSPEGDEVWYTIEGKRLPSKPSGKGLYIKVIKRRASDTAITIVK